MEYIITSNIIKHLHIIPSNIMKNWYTNRVFLYTNTNDPHDLQHGFRERDAR